MKPARLLLAWGLVASLSLAAQTPPPPVKLVGFVNLPGYKCALLSFANPRPGWTPPELILREGERINSLEVFHIFPERGAVELRLGGSNLVVALAGAATNAPASVPTIAFAGAGLKSALEIYGELSGRTLLRFPILPDRPLALRAFSGDKAEAAKFLSDAFATNGIAVVSDGEKFALVVPESAVPFFHPRSAEISAAARNVAADQIIKPGWIMLDGADFVSLAKMYANMHGREINRADWPREIPNAQFWFKNQTPMSKAEVIYAFDKMFEFWGLKMVPDGDKFLKPEFIRRQ